MDNMNSTTSKSLLNKLSNLKKKITTLKEDIKFIKDCKKHKIIPNFVKITCSIDSNITRTVKEKAEKHWLNLTLKQHYSKLQSVELETYDLHLKILKMYQHPIEFSLFDQFLIKTNTFMKKLAKTKQNTHEKKLKILLINKPEREKNESFFCRWIRKQQNKRRVIT